MLKIGDEVVCSNGLAFLPLAGPRRGRKVLRACFSGPTICRFDSSPIRTQAIVLSATPLRFPS